ncbi:hypothetical protein SAMN03080615_01947 [Amphritea atlantica]|uniref:Uncharacterized protein n=1 Tax=Amphritea atlantica TaxID=355243 RepID=A0A1H9H5E5_9GAMM|nr:hypothetical protein SAMN03080615_01947 [Amphritea atlantica]
MTTKLFFKYLCVGFFFILVNIGISFLIEKYNLSGFWVFYIRMSFVIFNFLCLVRVFFCIWTTIGYLLVRHDPYLKRITLMIASFFIWKSVIENDTDNRDI